MWRTVKARRLAPTTAQSYDDAARRIILPWFGDMDLTEITPFEVERFITHLYGRNLAPETVRRYLAVFRSMMTKAVLMGLIGANPAGYGRIEPIPHANSDVEVLALDDLQDLLEALEGEPLRWRAYVLFALDTGARRGECVGLQWWDIQDRDVKIRRSGYKITGKEKATKEPKGRKSRKVYMAASTQDVLKRWRRQQKKNCLAAGRSWNEKCFVFGNLGEMLHPSTPTAWFARFLRRHGLPDVRLHSLRHTSATQLLLHGVDLKTVSGRLGHADMEITQIYLHCMDDADRNAADCVEEFLYRKRKRV